MDTSPPAHARNTDISLSLARALPYWLILLLGTGWSAVMASGLIDGSSSTRVIGGVLFVALGLLTIAGLYMALTQRGVLVTLSPEGIRDIRLAPEVIPWSQVHGLRSMDVRVFGFAATRYIAVDINRDFVQRLALRRGARVTDDTAAPPGSVTLDLQTFALSMPHDEVVTLAETHWQQARQAAAG